ncbi:unnamed protein product, partial [Closterium sp. NIES-54]
PFSLAEFQLSSALKKFLLRKTAGGDEFGADAVLHWLWWLFYHYCWMAPRVKKAAAAAVTAATAAAAAVAASSTAGVPFVSATSTAPPATIPAKPKFSYLYPTFC